MIVCHGDDGFYEVEDVSVYHPSQLHEIPQELWDAYQGALALVGRVETTIEEYINATQPST